MSNLVNPTAVIFINNDLSAQVLSVIQQQLYITNTITKSEFDGYVAADGYFIDNIHALGERLLVIGDFQDQTNRALFDIVLFAKNGLIAVEKNNVGPHGITLPISRIYLAELFKYNLPRKPRCFNTTSTSCPCDSAANYCKCKYFCYCRKIICRYPFS
jgi:hypothetical protein